MRNLSSLLLWLMLWGVPAYGAAAVDETNAELEHFWRNNEQTLKEWLSTTKNHSFIRTLIDDHSLPSRNGRKLITLMTLARDPIIRDHEWLALATEAFLKKEYRSALNALEKIEGPLSEQDQPVMHFIRAQIALLRSHYSSAAKDYASIQPSSPLHLTAQYNLALTYIMAKQDSSAKLQLEWLQENRKKYSEKDRQLLVQLLAHIHDGSQQPQVLNNILNEWDENHQREGYGYFSALYHQTNQEQQQAIKSLLWTTTTFHHPQGISYSEKRLVETLIAAKAETQAREWAINKSKQLLNHYEKSLTFYQQLQRTPTNKPFSIDWKQTGIEPVPALESIVQNINRSILLIDKMQQSRARLEKIDTLLSIQPDQLRANINKETYSLYTNNPTLERELENKSAIFYTLEKKLSELVGTPLPFDNRYRLLDGLSLWVNLTSFPFRWWESGNDINSDQALQALSLLQDNIKQRFGNNNHDTFSKLKLHAKRLASKQMKTRERIQKSLSQLSIALKQKVTEQLQQDKKVLNESLLWLIVTTLPNQWESHTTIPEVRYTLSFPKPGSRRELSEAVISKREHQPPQPRLEQHALLLKDIALNATDKPLRKIALRALADMTLESADRIANSESGVDESGVKGSYQEAINYYTQLLLLENGDGRVEALYLLAKCYDLALMPAQTLATLNQLSLEFPVNPYSSEVAFRRAEIYFAEGDYERATALYSALASMPQRNEYSDKANYKLGWSSFKLGNYDSAMEIFFSIVDTHWDKPSLNTIGNKRVVDDTLRAISLTFSYMHPLEGLQRHFSRQRNRPYKALIYENVAQFLASKTRYTDAASVYRALIDLDRDAPSVPGHAASIIDAYEQGKFYNQVWEERERFVADYGLDSHYWRKQGDAVKQTIRPHLESYLALLAQRAHAHAQKSSNSADYAVAIGYYRHYLGVVAEGPIAAEKRLLLAEALESSGHLEEAAIEYDHVAYTSSRTPRSSDAAYSLLLVYQQLAKPPTGKKQQTWFAKGIEEAERFLVSFGKDQRARKVQTKLAEDLLYQGRDQQAVATARAALTSYRQIDEPLQLRLWTTIANGEFSLSDYPAAEQAFSQLLNLPLSAVVRATNQRMVAESIFKQAENAQRNGNRQAAVGHFLRIDKGLPSAPIRSKALYDAATLQMEMKQWPSALKTLTMFTRDYPQDRLVDSTIEKFIVIYEQSKNWALAAKYLRQLHELDPNSPLGIDALWRVGQLYQKAGDGQQAAANMQLFIERYPKEYERNSEARHQLYLLASARHAQKESDKWLRSLISYQDDIGSRGNDRTTYLAAFAAMTLAKEQITAFNQVRIEPPYRKNLKLKRTRMEGAFTWLSKASGYRIASFVTESTALSGKIFNEFASSLMTSARPRNLNELELEQYEIMLEEQALPFEDKSIEMHESNVARIADGLYDPWVEQSLQALRKLNSARYQRSETAPGVFLAIQ